MVASSSVNTSAPSDTTRGGPARLRRSISRRGALPQPDAPTSAIGLAAALVKLTAVDRRDVPICRSISRPRRSGNDSQIFDAEEGLFHPAR